MATIASYLREATAQLQTAGIDSARLDALILLEDTLRLDRAYLLAHDDAEIAPDHLQSLQSLIDRRQSHEPLAYIRGHAEFYGRTFVVNKHVLVPRPESEAIIALLKELAIKTAVDIGTGSGALAITAALELPHVAVTAIDIDDKCIETAKDNANRLDAKITFVKGNFLEPLLTVPVDVLLCNLPYVPENYSVNKAALHEPALALFAGKDGLDAYKTLTDQLMGMHTKPTFVITEALAEQHTALANIMTRAGYSLRKTQGLAQLFSL